MSGLHLHIFQQPSTLLIHLLILIENNKHCSIFRQGYASLSHQASLELLAERVLVVVRARGSSWLLSSKHSSTSRAITFESASQCVYVCLRRRSNAKKERKTSLNSLSQDKAEEVAACSLLGLGWPFIPESRQAAFPVSRRPNENSLNSLIRFVPAWEDGRLQKAVILCAVEHNTTTSPL